MFYQASNSCLFKPSVAELMDKKERHHEKSASWRAFGSHISVFRITASPPTEICLQALEWPSVGALPQTKCCHRCERGHFCSQTQAFNPCGAERSSLSKEHSLNHFPELWFQWVFPSLRCFRQYMRGRKAILFYENCKTNLGVFNKHWLFQEASLSPDSFNANSGISFPHYRSPIISIVCI